MPVPNPAKLKKEPSQSIFPSNDSKESAPMARWLDGVEWEVPQLTNEEVMGVGESYYDRGTAQGCWAKFNFVRREAYRWEEGGIQGQKR